jgi:hypothetical protein
MIRSRITASTTHRPPATTTFDLNEICDSIDSPSPPAPARNANVPRPTVVTEAMRRPAKISGRASGTSTRQSSWLSVKPIPRAASLISSGTLSRPVVKVRKIALSE